MTGLGTVSSQQFSPLGATGPDSRIINWDSGPHHKLMGKIPKSFHKHYDGAGPAQVSLQEDAVLLQEEGGHLGTQGPEAMVLGGSCLSSVSLQGCCRDGFPRVCLCPSFFLGK